MRRCWPNSRTSSRDVEFIVVLNHIAHDNAKVSREQAKTLRKWGAGASQVNLSAIAIGDYNFDYDFPTRQGQRGVDEFVRGDVLALGDAQSELIDTNWSDRDADGRDDYPHSCLDFAFVAGDAKKWLPESRVIVRDGDFPDDETTSDQSAGRVDFAAGSEP